MPCRMSTLETVEKRRGQGDGTHGLVPNGRPVNRQMGRVGFNRIFVHFLTFIFSLSMYFLIQQPPELRMAWKSGSGWVHFTACNAN